MVNRRGDLKSAIIGAATGAAFYEVGTFTNGHYNSDTGLFSNGHGGFGKSLEEHFYRSTMSGRSPAS